jgi:hypothetical protein
MDSMHPTVIEKWLNLSHRAYYVALLLGLAISTIPARSLIGNIVIGKNDFLQFYSGARLAGTPYLYDSAHIRDEQIAATGGFGVAAYYVRLPFYATLLSPLGKLPYHTSFWVWQAVSLAALVGFVALWRTPNTRFAILACCWSLPLLMVFIMGQDVTLLLLLLALTLNCYDERPMLAGLIMSLFAIKFNLFLLLPILFIGQRRWKMAAGFLLGSSSLIAISFAVAGWGWPVDMLRMLSSKGSFPREDVMPNIRGLLQPITDQFLPELLLVLLIASIVWMIVQHTDFEYGIAAVILGSLLASHHAGPQDAALAIPVLLIVASRSISTSVNYLCLLLFTPLPYLFLTAGHGLGSFTVLPLIALLFAMVIEGSRAMFLPPQVRKVNESGEAVRA